MTTLLRVLLSLVAAACLLASGALATAAAPKEPKKPAIPMHEFTPATSDEPLMNPGMGIYCGATTRAADIPPDAWFAKYVTIGYARDDWSKVAPDAEGVYRFEEYFGPLFDLWVKQWGKRLAFRFMSENMHSRQKYVTPKWVFDKGVPSVAHKGLYVPEQIDPVFWDERYLAVQERFIADLGKYLDGRPGLEFIDIGCIGEWGEMHLARWTPEQLQKTGYSEERYIGAYRRIIDAFARAFPRTRVFLNVGDYDTLNDYAAIRGVHFRQDGLNPGGPSVNVGKRFYHPYSRRGVICNYELFSGYQEMKEKRWGVLETFAKGLEDPISYFHINLMGYKELLNAPADVKGPILDLGKRLGYRFVPVRLLCNETLRLHHGLPGRLLLEHTWKNVGVAPCYDSYALRWVLADGTGKTVAEQLAYPRKPTTLWWPGEEVGLRSVMTVPAGLAPGTYRLKVAMVKPEEPTLRIALGIAGRDAGGFYVVAEVKAEKGDSTTAAVYEEGFEAGAAGWNAASGMTCRQDADAHTGQGSLLLTGTQAGNAWNYGAVSLKTPILPASRYRISCWMKVDSLSTVKKPPYLKIGLADAAGKWITNVSTNTYDPAKLGSWQLLEGYAETTPETAGGQLSIEKGTLEATVTATIRIDDVKVELLESP
jgi:hypothetical protein